VQNRKSFISASLRRMDKLSLRLTRRVCRRELLESNQGYYNTLRAQSKEMKCPSAGHCALATSLIGSMPLLVCGFRHASKSPKRELQIDVGRKGGTTKSPIIKTNDTGFQVFYNVDLAGRFTGSINGTPQAMTDGLRCK